MTPRRLLTLLALLVTAMVIEPATAATPTFSGCGKFVKDNAADGSDPTGPAPKEAEIVAAWIDAGGPKPSLNIQIADLTGSVAPPATSITYDAIYGGVGDQDLTFVRAYLDFAGMVAYEYGHQETLPSGNPRYVYDGDTEGEMFTGEQGVVRVVIPPEAGGKAGQVLKGVTPETQVGRSAIVPGAVNVAPTRGFSFQNDTSSLGNVTLGDCAPGTTTPPGGGGGGGGGTTPPPGGGTPNTQPPSSQAPPAPVTLVTKSLKRAKAKKAVKVKMKTTEALTAVAVRLSKGSKVFGTGKLSKLTRTGTVKFKLKKAIKKGTYAFDVAGTDGQGRRRIATLKLKVR